MRQAGRYMPEYQRVRSKVTFLELCKRPELACEVTVTAQERLGVDAAILFADLLPILEPMGFKLDYIEKTGPVIFNPVTSPADLSRVMEHDARETMPFTAEAVRMLCRTLKPDIPLIGFSGLPFTLAAYAVEGGGSRNHERTKAFMHTHPREWNALLDKLSNTIIKYVAMQLEAGAHAIQLFDSWVGCLSPSDFREYVLPHTKKVVAGVKAAAAKSQAPVILFGTGTATLLDAMNEARPDVMGIDWHTPLGEAWKRLGIKSVQGNLDPCVLFADVETVRRKAGEVMRDAGGRPGHIFNLGHGILPKTPVDNVLALVEYVHGFKL